MKYRLRRMLFDLTIVLIVFFGFMALVTSVNGAECGDKCSIVMVEKVQDTLECKEDSTEHSVFKRFANRVNVIKKFKNRKFFSRLFRRS